jgi:hypothetical protein
LKNDVNVPLKSNKQNNLKKMFFVCILKDNDENSRSESGSISQRHGSADPGSTPKCHGSATLQKARRVQYCRPGYIIRTNPDLALFFSSFQEKKQVFLINFFVTLMACWYKKKKHEEFFCFLHLERNRGNRGIRIQIRYSKALIGGSGSVPNSSPGYKTS